MVDNAVIARKLAAIRDAVERIRQVLPDSVEVFLADRTAREIVVLNLFIGLQESISVATHWLADAGWDVPRSYGDAFVVLADRRILDPELASRLKAASGLRNLIAHQYGVVDMERVYALVSSDLEDLVLFCKQIAERIADAGGGDV